MTNMKIKNKFTELQEYAWRCSSCGKEGNYRKPEWVDVVLRCPYCRSMDIESLKVV